MWLETSEERKGRTEEGVRAARGRQEGTSWGGGVRNEDRHRREMNEPPERTGHQVLSKRLEYSGGVTTNSETIKIKDLRVWVRFGEG